MGVFGPDQHHCKVAVNLFDRKGTMTLVGTSWGDEGWEGVGGKCAEEDDPGRIAGAMPDHL